VVFGSFITAKAEPNDIDILLLMEDTFDLAAVTGEAAVVFQHLEAHVRFGARIFLTRRSGARGGEQAMIESWSVAASNRMTSCTIPRRFKSSSSSSRSSSAFRRSDLSNVLRGRLKRVRSVWDALKYELPTLPQ